MRCRFAVAVCSRPFGAPPRVGVVYCPSPIKESVDLHTVVLKKEFDVDLSVTALLGAYGLFHAPT